MIKNFRDGDTQALFSGKTPRRFGANVCQRMLDRLQVLHTAAALADLRIPPSNRLEALRGNRLGWHSIRINDQWRLCFRWHDGDAYDVEIVDYH